MWKVRCQAVTILEIAHDTPPCYRHHLHCNKVLNLASYTCQTGPTASIHLQCPQCST